MLTYVGIADCYGLESFIPTISFVLEKLRDAPSKNISLENTLSYLNLKAQANRHRHAIIYRVKLNSRRAKIIQSLFDDQKYKEALIKLKKLAAEVEVGKSPGMAKSWKMIPNDNLDPYS